MHDCMPYDPIQGEGHRASEVPKIALFHVYLLRHLQWQLANNHLFLNYTTISKFDQAQLFLFFLVLWHVTLNLEGSLRTVRPRKSLSDFSDI